MLAPYKGQDSCKTTNQKFQKEFCATHLKANMQPLATFMVSDNNWTLAYVFFTNKWFHSARRQTQFLLIKKSNAGGSSQISGRHPHTNSTANTPLEGIIIFSFTANR